MSSQLKTYKFHMEMTCGGCANAAKNVLMKRGVEEKNIATNVDEKTVTVTSELDEKLLFETLQKTGKKIEYLK